MIEITNSRVFPHPVGAVFGAFSDPILLAQWWGPEGFRNTFREFDLRPEGLWTFVMHGPDHIDYPNHSRFIDVVKNRSIAFEHLDDGQEYTMTMLYEDLGASRTQLTWLMVLGEEKAEHRDFIYRANEQNFDRLEAILERLKS